MRNATTTEIFIPKSTIEEIPHPIELLITGGSSVPRPDGPILDGPLLGLHQLLTFAPIHADDPLLDDGQPRG